MESFATSLKLPKKLNMPNNFTFGVEIEFEKARIKNVEHKMIQSKLDGLLSKGWVLKQDNSLCKYSDSIGIGGELTSPVLRDNVDSYKEIRNACHIVEQCDGLATENCGGHIHIGSKLLNNNKKYYIRLMKLWVIYENEIVRFSLGETLEKRPFLDYYAKSNFNLFSKAEVFEDSQFYEMMFVLGADKNMAMSFKNLAPYRDFHTVEIRCPNGTINPDIWKNNINFFAHLLLICKDETRDWDRIDKLYDTIRKNNKEKHIVDYNIEKAVELSDFVFNDTIDKYNFILQYTKDSKILTR